MCSSDLFDCLKVNDYSRLSIANTEGSEESGEDIHIHKTAMKNTTGNMWKAACVLLIFVQVFCFCLKKHEKNPSENV